MLSVHTRREREVPAHAAGDLPLDSLSDLGAALAAQPYAKRGVPASDTVIRVALVDDHTLVREGVRALLQTESDIKVVAETGSGVEAPAMVEQSHPDVVIMDLDMPGIDGIEATRALLAGEAKPKVLVLTMHAEEQRLVNALHAGASGYLMKDAAETELIEAIRAVARGDVYVRPRVAQMLAANLRPNEHLTDKDRALQRFEELSDREQTVLRLVAEGYNGPEIGRMLNITAKTVDTYKQRINEKLGLSHRTDYVRFALTIDLLKR
jgi:DNA-binding NarL/FixJ family response regulator